KQDWKPDFGPSSLNARSGATAVGARDFLVAYNINLNTTSIRRANAIAFDVREKGRVKREGDKLTGKALKDKNGNTIYAPGSLKSVKAIGWYIEEYGVAQISMNLTNVSITPVHIAFDEVCKKASERGVRVTGSEIVGLVPLKTMIDAGKYFLKKQQRSSGISDKEIIKIAAKSMGLDDLTTFKPDDKIIEYRMNSKSSRPLIHMPLNDFCEETASESPAPGGGSISAYVGSLGIALGTMVANLSSHKRGWDGRWEEFSEWAEKGKKFHEELCDLVDEDTLAFNRIMEAFSLPKSNDKEKKDRKRAIQLATKYAIVVPFQVMKASFRSMEVIKAMAENGNPNSITDAGVGALCARSAVIGAYLNVRINAKDLEDESFVNKTISEGGEIVKKAEQIEKEILKIVDEKI
ncbi:MAG TPA: glutamate formimidoyltransferase, partial [Bacteroidetes bacterium]|nr:glutamate formimidoyltransferase [Bacteroidota bacterium]